MLAIPQEEGERGFQKGKRRKSVTMDSRRMLLVGAALAGLAVAAGAFGAHLLKPVLDGTMLAVFETGVRYHMYHALALCVIASIGGSAEAFEAYVHGPARAEHDRIIDEAEALGVFGVPTMVFNGELFWGGDRIDMLIERIGNPESIVTALGSRHKA